MTEQQPAPHSDYFMNDQRRQQLRDNPSHVLTDSRGRRISLLFEKQGGLHMVFASIEERGREQSHELSAIGNSLEYAIRGIGRDIYDRYVMATTGEVPRPSPFL